MRRLCLPRSGDLATLPVLETPLIRPDFMAGPSVAAPLRLLSETLEATLAAREPQAVLRAAAGALCRGLPAAGALWILAEDDNPHSVEWCLVKSIEDLWARRINCFPFCFFLRQEFLYLAKIGLGKLRSQLIQPGRFDLNIRWI